MSLTEGRENWVRVVNHNPFKFVGRFAGRDYVFVPEKPVDLSEEAVNHIFDIDKDDKSRAILRLGWAATGADMETAMEKLAKISFDDPPEMMEVPAQPKKPRGPKRTGTAAPAVNASGSEGDAEIGEPPPLIKAPPNGLRIAEAEAAGDEDEDEAEDDTSEL